MLDRAGVITLVNAAWTGAGNRHNVTPGDIGPGDDVLAVCRSLGDDPAALALDAGIARVAAGEQAAFSLTFDGSPPFAERRYALDARSARVPRGGTILIVSDVTTSHLAWEATRREERRFASPIRHGVDLITIIDTDGVVSYQSSTLRHTPGNDLADASGRNVFGLVHPEGRPLPGRCL